MSLENIVRHGLSFLKFLRELVQLFVTSSTIQVIAVHEDKHINIHRKCSCYIDSSIHAATLVYKSAQKGEELFQRDHD